MSKNESSQEIKIIPKAGEWHERTYANYAQVSKTPFDISIKFCDVPPIEQEQKEILEKGQIEVPIASEVVLSPRVAKGFIAALQAQLNEYHKLVAEESID